MDLSDDTVQQHAEADRRAVGPPILVEMATWSRAGRLDWWVKERRELCGRVRGAEVVNGGSELLIFVPRGANDRVRWSQGYRMPTRSTTVRAVPTMVIRAV